MTPSKRTEWDGATYHRVSGPQFAWAQKVLDRVEFRGDEVVLDAGCGSGRGTELIRDRVPRGRVIGVDGSASMIERARETLGPEAELHVQDLLELSLAEPVDVVISTATFHWIHDHERLFARLHAVLAPGGRLVAQCGGKGNISRLHRIAHERASTPERAPRFEDWAGAWNFASPEETVERLGRAGFVEGEAWLEPAPVVPDEPFAFVKTVCLAPFLERLESDDRDPFVQECLDGLGEPPVLDYVRLNITARRPA